MPKTGMIVKLTAAPGRRDEVAAAFDDMVAHIASEEGTQLYILHDDQGDPDVLWVYELYRDQEALEVHSGSEAMLALFGALGGGQLAAAPELVPVTPRAGKGLPD